MESIKSYFNMCVLLDTMMNARVDPVWGVLQGVQILLFDNLIVLYRPGPRVFVSLSMSQ